MKTKAIRLYGANDVKMEEFELRPIAKGEILIKIICDSVCMSTYKTILQGENHIRVPNGISENPVILGHEFCAEIVEVGEKWKDKYGVGDKVIIPPVLSYLNDNQTIGYSFKEIGGASTYAIVYEHIIENYYLIKLNSDSYFKGSLIEPVSCVVRGYKANFHLDANFEHVLGIKENGKVVILAGCGPMGLVAIDIALNGQIKPSLVVVTDLDEARLARAKEIYPVEKVKEKGIQLIFSKTTDKDELISYTNGTGYDDVFVYAPVPAVVELGDNILGFDGCLNFFAGPLDKSFSTKFNFYNVHYQQHHTVGTSGSTIEDIKDVVKLMGENAINPSVMITHIGGLDSAINTTTNLPKIPGGKKLIYTHINLELTALSDFEELGKSDVRFSVLDRLVKENNGLWNAEAEKYLLENF